MYRSPSLCSRFTQPINHRFQEFGIVIITRDNKTTVHRNVASYVPASIPFQYPPFPPIILPSVTSAPASDNNFSFAHQQPTRCHGQQHASTAQNRLSLDHTLSRFKGELQKSRDKGAKLISLSMSKNDIRGTFGAPAVHPPSFLYALFSQPQDFLHFPQSFPYVR
ncbi:hypothetical protein K503DRAFT_785707 [Rhizopogon vinicolor AM-OR11-026]|uniref:Uncharacterized protein n=1 Tax=Rhizopogon vinicolor AM-OR11-026 TaxID=1314800 RepID=A0A1B7MPI6_9AGAM|nr:hypothetical protein K503DRAFT_785707 [Rhizopogon vinicolor AM-OR11-026]